MRKDSVWKEVPNFEGLYRCNQYGDVMNSKGKILKKLHRGDGYYQYTLCKNGKRHSIKEHRIVAMLFVDNPRNCKNVNHIDGNKHNNYYKNLEWCTIAENNRHAWSNGLNYNTAKQRASARKGIVNARKNSIIARRKKVICCETNQIFESITEAAKVLNLQASKISLVCHEKRKSTGGYTFKFL